MPLAGKKKPRGPKSLPAPAKPRTRVPSRGLGALGVVAGGSAGGAKPRRTGGAGALGTLAGGLGLGGPFLGGTASAPPSKPVVRKNTTRRRM